MKQSQLDARWKEDLQTKKRSEAITGRNWSSYWFVGGFKLSHPHFDANSSPLQAWPSTQNSDNPDTAIQTSVVVWFWLTKFVIVNSGQRKDADPRISNKETWSASKRHQETSVFFHPGEVQDGQVGPDWRNASWIVKISLPPTLFLSFSFRHLEIVN